MDPIAHPALSRLRPVPGRLGSRYVPAEVDGPAVETVLADALARGDADLAARALLPFAPVALSDGRADAVGAGCRALASARLDPPLRCAVLALEAWYHRRRRHTLRATEIAGRLVSVARTSGDPELLAWALIELADHLADGDDALVEAVALPVSDPDVLLGHVALVRAFHGDRLEPYREARARFVAAGAPWLVALADSALCTALLTHWRLDEAAAVARRCEGPLAEGGFRRHLVMVRLVRGYLTLHRGKLRPAEIAARTREAESLGDAGLELAARMLAVDHAIVRGRWDEARALAADAVVRFRDCDEPEMSFWALSALLAAGPDPREAEAIRAELDAAAEWIPGGKRVLELHASLAALATDGPHAGRVALGRVRGTRFDHYPVATALRSHLAREPGVRVASDGSSFEVAGARPVDLGRRGPLRRVLACLVAAGGAPVSVGSLFAAGWPDERATEESMRGRVYVTVHRLRDLGLRGALRTASDGFVLDQGPHSVAHDMASHCDSKYAAPDG